MVIQCWALRLNGKIIGLFDTKDHAEKARDKEGEGCTVDGPIQGLTTDSSQGQTLH